MKNAFFPLMIITLLSGVAHAATTETAPPPPKPECHDIIYRKWNDLLFVDNGNNEYVSYQWYQDGTIMAGETKQYIYTEGVVLNGNGHTYYVIATRANGTQVMSCDNFFEDFPKSVDDNPGTVRKAALYTPTGRKMGEWSYMPTDPQVAPGCYIWQITNTMGQVRTQRVVY
ncbi:MAG: hypothetical protein MJZ65_04070 [Paludibacteraceae bacterium]|nr:hypothetical protein [Paludibacteraceae bacterium]